MLWRCDRFTSLLSKVFTKQRCWHGWHDGADCLFHHSTLLKKGNKTDKGEQTWFSVPVWQEHASSHFACMWVTHTVPSCSAESAAPPLCPPTSAAQKQSPAFSSQMEVTPYASKPLSLCHGSSTNTSRGNKEREEDAALSAHQRCAGVHLLKVLGNNAVCWILMRPDNGLSARSDPRSRQIYLCIHTHAKHEAIHAVSSLTVSSQQDDNSQHQIHLTLDSRILTLNRFAILTTRV